MEEVTQRPTIEEIREKLGQLKGTLEEKTFLPSSDVPGGIPRGVICEITGTARTEWLLRFLAENPSQVTFWAEERLTILPTALHQRGVDLSHVLMAETGDKLFQTLRKALRSKLFDLVVLPGAIDETKMLKALQLFARESNACVFFLSKVARNAWAIPFQLSINWNDGAREYEVQILKSKFSQTGSA